MADIARLARQALPFFAQGRVVHGFERGSKELGVPTANFPDEVVENLPEDLTCGVYCGFASLNDSTIYPMVSNLSSSRQHLVREGQLPGNAMQLFLIRDVGMLHIVAFKYMQINTIIPICHQTGHTKVSFLFVLLGVDNKTWVCQYKNPIRASDKMQGMLFFYIYGNIQACIGICILSAGANLVWKAYRGCFGEMPTPKLSFPTFVYQRISLSCLAK